MFDYLKYVIKNKLTKLGKSISTFVYGSVTSIKPKFHPEKKKSVEGDINFVNSN
jgi:hypothetical protein